MHITRNNEFWEEENHFSVVDSVNQKVQNWLTEVSHYRKKKCKSKHSSSKTPKVRNLVLHGKSKHKISLMPEIIKLTDKIRENEIVSNPLLNRARPRDQSRKLLEGSLTLTEEIFITFRNLQKSICLLQDKIEQNETHLTVLSLSKNLKQPTASTREGGDRRTNLQECGACKSKSLRQQLIDQILKQCHSLIKEEILQRLNEIVYPERESVNESIETKNLASIDAINTPVHYLLKPKPSIFSSNAQTPKNAFNFINPNRPQLDSDRDREAKTSSGSTRAKGFGDLAKEADSKQHSAISANMSLFQLSAKFIESIKGKLGFRSPKRTSAKQLCSPQQARHVPSLEYRFILKGRVKNSSHSLSSLKSVSSSSRAIDRVHKPLSDIEACVIADINNTLFPAKKKHETGGSSL